MDHELSRWFVTKFQILSWTARSGHPLWTLQLYMQVVITLLTPRDHSLLFVLKSHPLHRNISSQVRVANNNNNNNNKIHLSRQDVRGENVTQHYPGPHIWTSWSFQDVVWHYPRTERAVLERRNRNLFWTSGIGNLFKTIVRSRKEWSQSSDLVM